MLVITGPVHFALHDGYLFCANPKRIQSLPVYFQLVAGALAPVYPLALMLLRCAAEDSQDLVRFAIAADSSLTLTHTLKLPGCPSYVAARPRGEDGSDLSGATLLQGARTAEISELTQLTPAKL